MPAVPAGTRMKSAPQPARRFTDKPDLDPSAVWSLPTNHPALIEGRTLFPSTVVDVDESFEDRLLVSGKNNRKLGETITKGAFKGYALYGFSLEERATCSPSCAARGYCYGNGMQMARRHRIKDAEFFYVLLEDEIRELLEDHPSGVMVRLHVLGDFPSVEYVAMWADLLDVHPKLACYGYTHWPMNSEIGRAIAGLKGRFSSRFRIRWSCETPQPDGAIVINEIPKGPRFNGALVCPAQTDATACCASCGMCWESATRKETIAFIKHGKRSLETAASEISKADVRQDSRGIMPIPLPSSLVPAILVDVAPKLRLVPPQSLKVESAYQRDLSAKSLSLIRKIVSGWDWAKFKPPVCAETDGGLFVIDGQHTAIAAASHPGIKEIPVIVTAAPNVGRRARAFVSHNRDRLTMTPAQIFYGDLAANDGAAKNIMNACVKTGATVPRLPPAKTAWRPGQISAIGELRGAYKVMTTAEFERVLRIAVLAKTAPISKLILRGLRSLVTEPQFAKAAKASDAAIASAIVFLGDLESASDALAAENGLSRFSACAELIGGALP